MSSPEQVLVTGATGFLGSHLVLHLLKTSRAQVHCVVRGTATQRAEQRLVDKLRAVLSSSTAGDERFGPLADADWARLVVHDGDITKEHLGLDAPSYARLAPATIWHVAADVRFETHLRPEVFETNVVGTHQVVTLARAKACAQLNYVSTAYVAGERSGKIEEGPARPEYPANNPYEESKRIAETEVAQLAGEGIRVRIFRPSVIIGHSRNMVGDAEAGLSAYLRVLFKVKETVERRMPEYFEHNPLRLGFDDSVTLNIVCVDHVVEVMARAAQQQPERGLDYHHVVNPKPTSIAAYLGSLSEVLQIRIVNVANIETLGPIDHLLWMKTDVYRSYHRDSKEFDCARTLALAGVPASALEVSAETEKRYSRWVYESYLADRRVERSRERSAVHLLTRARLSHPSKPALSYFAGGSGSETLLLLNAYGQSLAFWDRMVPLLLKRFRVIAWQARGTSSQGAGLVEVFPIDDHVDDLVGILEQEQVQQCHVLAWCTGPKVAIELNARLPGRLQSLVFLASCFKGLPGLEAHHTEYERHMDVICRALDERPELAAGVMDILKRVVADEQPAPSAEPREDYDERVHQVLAMVPEDIKPLVLEPFLTPDNVVSYARQLLAFWSHDVSERLPQGQLPVLMVGGELDNIASSGISRAVAARVPGAVYAEVAAGSHYMQFDNAELLDDLLQRFVSAPKELVFESRQIQLTRSIAVTPAASVVARAV